MVRFYNQALSSQDVANLYNSEAPPPPPPPALNIYTAVELQFDTVAGQTYQIQTSPDLVTWTNFGAPIVGDGNSWSNTYSTRGMPKVFYRVVIVH